MSISRRQIFATLAAGALTAVAAPRRRFRIGVTDWNLRLSAKPESVALAARLGFEGVEVSLGRVLRDGKLPVDSDAVIATYLAEARKHNILLAGTCLDLLHPMPLKKEKESVRYIADAIRITKKLDAKVLLLPLFGPGSPDLESEQDYVADALKEVTPLAEKAGIRLGLEDQLSARANVRIMERTKSPAVSVYYDVGNSTRWQHDVLREIEWLGAARICQMHLKEDPTSVRLGTGRIPFPQIVKVMEKIGFTGFANLETSSKTDPVDTFMAADLAYIKGLRA